MHTAASSDSARFHIVILEDNELDFLTVKRSIQEAGVDCEFTAFADGEEALAYVNEAATRVADLMILDLNIPKVEGASVLNSIRGNPRWAHVSVAVLTASQDPGDIARVKLLGADDYFIKPMDLTGFAKIGSAVKEWLKKRPRASGA
jgi:chemotaxis family two-component system response regulator Rcp1